MRPLRKFEPLFLVVAVAITRFLVRSHLLYDVDSVNFSLGIKHFDPAVYQPHPPGYFLYILLGRAVNTLVHDPNLALVLISIVASCGTVVLIYRLGLEWFGRDAARFAGLLFLFSPLAWFHGEVALTYSVEAFFSILLGYLCWRVLRGDARCVVWAAITLGVASGFRPSSFLFLAPLFLFSIRRVSARSVLLGLGTLAATLAAWFFPMMAASGGFHAYFGALLTLWLAVPSKHTVLNSPVASSIARAATIVFIYILGFGAASLAPLTLLLDRNGASDPGGIDPEKKAFTLVWLLPALCFFTFVFLKFVNSGYLLLLVPPASLWMGRWIAEWYRQGTPRGKQFKLAVLSAAAAINVAIFLASPLYCSWRSIHRFEHQVRNLQRALPQVAPESQTLIVAFDSHFFGFRHAGYYFPGYLTAEYPEVQTTAGPRAFIMHDRNTRFVSSLPIGSCRQFVLFPLPNKISFRQYLRHVEERLPAKDVKVIHVDGDDFVTGPIADLPLLLPRVAEVPKDGVYVAIHPGAERVNNRRHPDR